LGQADIDKLLKAAALLAEQDYVTLLGSETGKVVAAIGKSELAKGVKAGNIIKVRPRPSEVEGADGRSWPRAEGRTWKGWMMRFGRGWKR
jgi:hypothetical protein